MRPFWYHDGARVVRDALRGRSRHAARRGLAEVGLRPLGPGDHGVILAEAARHVEIVCYKITVRDQVYKFR